MTESESEARYDGKSTYCRMLGHEVSFSYCRKPVAEIFCRKLRDCWADKLDVDTFITENYSEEQIQVAQSPPKPKMVSLLDLIKRAQEAD